MTHVPTLTSTTGRFNLKKVSTSFFYSTCSDPDVLLVGSVDQVTVVKVSFSDGRTSCYLLGSLIFTQRPDAIFESLHLIFHERRTTPFTVASPSIFYQGPSFLRPFLRSNRLLSKEVKLKHTPPL